MWCYKAHKKEIKWKGELLTRNRKKEKTEIYVFSPGLKPTQSKFAFFNRAFSIDRYFRSCNKTAQSYRYLPRKKEDTQQIRL